MREIEVFIGRMGHYANGEQGLVDGASETLTDHFWAVWAIAKEEGSDELDEIEDEEFPLADENLALGTAMRLCVKYGVELTRL